MTIPDGYWDQSYPPSLWAPAPPPAPVGARRRDTGDAGDSAEGGPAESPVTTGRHAAGGGRRAPHGGRPGGRLPPRPRPLPLTTDPAVGLTRNPRLLPPGRGRLA